MDFVQVIGTCFAGISGQETFSGQDSRVEGVRDTSGTWGAVTDQTDR